MQFKDDAKEHYSFYWLNSTKDRVYDTIVKELLTSMKDIMNHLQFQRDYIYEKNIKKLLEESWFKTVRYY